MERLFTIHNKIFLLLVTLICTSGLIHACAYPRSISVGEINHSGWRTERWAETTEIHGPDFRVTVYSANPRSGYDIYPYPGHFLIHLRFWQNKSGERLKIDFSRISLHLPAKRSEIKPVKALVVSGKVSPELQQLQLLCMRKGAISLNQYHAGKPISEEIVNLQNADCIALMFDIEVPPPETEFVLKITGLYLDDRLYPMPDIQFKKGKVLVLDINK